VKVAYFSKYNSRGPSSRYRIYQFLPQFRSTGFDVRVFPLFDDEYFKILKEPEPSQSIKKTAYTPIRFRRRRAELREVRSDLIIIEQQLFPYMPISVEKRYLPERFLLEFDDAIYLTHPKKLPELIRRAACVIAGNRTLAEYAEEFNANVVVIPSVLDASKFCPIPKMPTGKTIIGWTGLEYNFRYLKILDPLLKKLCEKYPLEVVVISGSPPNDLSFPFRFVEWNGDREVEQINEFDIGVMPLEIDDWCRGKCGFKLLQYMSLEIPAVATSVGVNRQIVQSGRNGFLAENARDWEQHLVTLIENPQLRAEMGKQARSTVLEHYSVDVWFPTLAALYRKFAAQ
jgi:glycosyltransferase involved in cell wall biosynthesis